MNFETIASFENAILAVLAGMVVLIWLMFHRDNRRMENEQPFTSFSDNVLAEQTNSPQAPKSVKEIRDEIYLFQEAYFYEQLDKDRHQLLSPEREAVALYRLRLYLMSGPGHLSTLLDTPDGSDLFDIQKGLGDFGLPDLAAIFAHAETLIEDHLIDQRSADLRQAHAGTLIDRRNRPTKTYIRHQLNLRDGERRLSVVLTQFLLETFGTAGVPPDILAHAQQTIAPPEPREPYVIPEKRPIAPYFQKARSVASQNYEKLLASQLSDGDLNILRLSELIAALSCRDVAHFADTTLDDIMISGTCKLLAENDAADLAQLFEKIMQVWLSYRMNEISGHDQEHRFQGLFYQVNQAGGEERLLKIADEYAFSHYPWKNTAKGL